MIKKLQIKYPREYQAITKKCIFYIIDDGMVDAQGRKMPPFLRQCREIDAKKEKLL